MERDERIHLARPGKSLPFGMMDPLSRSDRQAYAPSSRVDPSRLPAQYMSLVWWLACIDGMTPATRIAECRRG